MFLTSFKIFSQFAPEVGQTGTTAIHSDSNIFISWVDSCTIFRGFVDISDTSKGKVDYGQANNVLGKANNSAISLGDAGFAICKFNKPIRNGSGFDFAVFENSFDNYFLELAFVEVSSDGENYFRFNSVSNTQDTTQIATFGTLEASSINNLAGKYRAMYGTPFDLEELKNKESLDLDNVRFIKIIDVVGDISGNFSSYDSNNKKINDPFPTPFNTGGFDLDAIGVINNSDNTIIQEITNNLNIRVYPSLVNDKLNIDSDIKKYRVEIYNSTFNFINCYNFDYSTSIDLSSFPKGMYFIIVKSNSNVSSFKIIKM